MMVRNCFRKWVLPWACLLSVIFVSGARADHDHSKKQRFFEREIEEKGLFQEEDHGNEATGETAAWLFAIANIPAVLALTARHMLKRSRSSTSRKKWADFYTFNRRRLMPIHYVGNLSALGIALWHFVLSRCRSTSLPEWALALLLGFALLGLLMKFRLGFPSLIKTARTLHTSPAVVVILFMLLWVGHQMLD
ncbi:hypothetical protein [Thermodesulforhabdus norvegica]|uniref:Uncharacterized protein n=1 Tax=Thermodesulforhabdus norvegica TaxID=39841 RepID=A0A1I4V7L0_9BACT|nr:hypothetical protein [Thermodesulforhabdus norvegica]SFM97138.1 hypothetical protein SAMN05660836_02150 [Thermodesulforhabdus norvegica]